MVRKKHIKLMDLAIKKMAYKNGIFHDDECLARMIWNIFTNNNSERKRCLKALEYIARGNDE